MSSITNLQLALAFEKYLKEGWGYVYGAQGELYSKELAEKWKDENRSVPSKSWNVETYFTEKCAKWFGKQVADCSGGIVYAIRQYDKSYYDRNTGTFKKQFTESGDMDTLPEIPGIALWYTGHIGIYVGNGKAIEFRGTNYGCVKTNVADRNWKCWGKIQGVDYIETKKEGFEMELDLIKKGSSGAQVKALQVLLNANGFACDADGIAGTKTETAIKKYQSAHSLTADGIAGQKTWSMLLKGK